MGTPRIAGLAALAALAGLLAACGPVEYVSQVTRRASTNVVRARQARADELAPYEYTLAIEYLHKAREEASYSDFQAANRFGRKAARSAELAAELAEARAADPERAARELPPKDVDRDGAGMAPLDDETAPDSDGTDEAPAPLQESKP